MRWRISVVHSLSFDTAVVPQRKSKEETIVRPAGFTSKLSSMDVPRVGVAAKKRKRRIMMIAGSALGLILATIAISRLKPAVPSIDRSTVWIDTVKRGPMVRQVRGLGTLVPEDIRWIPANTEGRVEKINIWPGTPVEPDSVILELSSPELEQAAHDAESKATAAEADLTSLRATLQRELLDQESKTTVAHAAYEQAKMERQTNDQLSKNGLVADLVYKTSKIKEEECQKSDEIEQKRLAFARDSIQPQLASKQAAVDQANQLAKLKLDQVEALHVKAGMSGVLQQLPVQIGQRLKVGDNLARVADPTKLKAQVKLGKSAVNTIEILSGLQPGDRVILSDTSAWDTHDRIRLN